MSEDLNEGSLPKLDLDYLNGIAGGSNEFVIEMIDIFLDQTPGYLDQISIAVDAGEWDSVANFAHKIKPTLAFMGANQASADMQKIETNARNKTDVGTIASEFAALKKICLHLFEQLKVYKTDLESQL